MRPLWLALAAYPLRSSGAATAPVLFPQLPTTSKLEPIRAIRILVRDLSSEVPGSYDSLYGASARAMHGLAPSRSVQSSAQAQALLTASFAAASPAMQRTDQVAAAEEVLRYALSFFLGWKRMCRHSHLESCQLLERQQGAVRKRRAFNCGVSHSWQQQRHPCLPHRSWNRTLDGAETTGSSSDADTDAILALIVLVVRFEGQGKTWWYDMGQWAYDSCKAFMQVSSELNADGSERLIKPGSCGEAWTCTNPSYLSPAHYRVFDRYMVDYAMLFGNAEQGADSMADAMAMAYTPMWSQLVKTAYKVLFAAHCQSTGLFAGAFVPDSAHPAAKGKLAGRCRADASKRGDEFGEDSARIAWRLFLDYAWFTGASDWKGDRQPQQLLRPLTLGLVSRLKNIDVATCHQTSCDAQLELSLNASCPLVQSVQQGWTDTASMTAPLAAALMIPAQPSGPAAEKQRVALVAMAQMVQGHFASSQVADSAGLRWSTLSLLTMVGAASSEPSVVDVPHARQKGPAGGWRRRDPRPPNPPPDPPAPPRSPSPPPPPPPPDPHPPSPNPVSPPPPSPSPLLPPPPHPASPPAPPSPPPECILGVKCDITYAKGKLFEAVVNVAHHVESIVLRVAFGNTVLSRISHTADVVFLSGEQSSVLTFELVEAKADGSAYFEFTAHADFELTGKHDPRIVPTITCEGSFVGIPPSPPPPPPSVPPSMPPFHPPSPPPPLLPPEAPPPYPPPPPWWWIPSPPPSPHTPPEVCALGVGFSAIHVSTKRLQGSVHMVEWREGTQMTLNFRQPIDGRVDQGTAATLQMARSTASSLLFELWERPRSAVTSFTFFILANREGYELPRPQILCTQWRPLPPPPAPPPPPPLPPPPPPPLSPPPPAPLPPPLPRLPPPPPPTPPQVVLPPPPPPDSPPPPPPTQPPPSPITPASSPPPSASPEAAVRLAPPPLLSRQSAVQAAPPLPPPLICQHTCHSNPKEWSSKCHWSSCRRCPECSSASSKLPAAVARSPPPPTPLPQLPPPQLRENVAPCTRKPTSPHAPILLAFPDCSTASIGLPTEPEPNRCDRHTSLTLQFKAVGEHSWMSLEPINDADADVIFVDGLDAHSQYLFRLIRTSNAAGSSMPSDALGPLSAAHHVSGCSKATITPALPLPPSPTVAPDVEELSTTPEPSTVAASSRSVVHPLGLGALLLGAAFACCACRRRSSERYDAIREHGPASMNGYGEDDDDDEYFVDHHEGLGTPKSFSGPLLLMPEESTEVSF